MTSKMKEKLGVIVLNMVSGLTIVIGGGYLIAKYALPLIGWTLIP